MSYSEDVTAAIERAILARMDEQTRRELAEAAHAYEEAAQAPKKASDHLKSVIAAAADAGEKPAAITRAIGHVYTYDYVARLVRERRKQRQAAA